MEYTNSLKSFLTDDQILDCLLLFNDGNKVEAAKLLRSYLFDKWIVNVSQAMSILIAVNKEFYSGYVTTKKQINKIL